MDERSRASFRISADGGRIPVAEAIQLPRVDGKDVEAPVHGRIDHGPSRGFNRHGNLGRSRLRSVERLHERRSYRGRIMLDLLFNAGGAVRIDQTQVMHFAAPIDAQEPVISLHRHPPAFKGTLVGGTELVRWTSRSKSAARLRFDFALTLSGPSEEIRHEVHDRSIRAPSEPAPGCVLPADWELPDER